MSRYQQYCETACPDGCGKGIRRWRGESRERGVWFEHRPFGSAEVTPCTALSESAWAEEVAGNLEAYRCTPDCRRCLTGEGEHNPDDSVFTEIDRLTAEGDRLERELAAMTEARDGLMEAHADLGAEAARLERELAEAKRDGERLDWMEAQKYACWGTAPNAMQNNWERAIETGGESYRGRNLRECVDAAMSAREGDGNA